jgi:uncharacterized RDD family membrane protein YckC
MNPTASPADLRPASTPEDVPVPARNPLPSWKSEARSRVSAHRARAGRVPENQPALPGMENALTPASIAARVAERYSRIPSWRETLARQAAAAAAAAETAVPQPEPEPTPAPAPQPIQQELLRYSVSSDSLPAVPVTPLQARVPTAAHPHHDPEVSDPFEEALVEPTRPLPARLLATPRELVAPRKARPHLAEGPLHEDDGPAFRSAAPALPEGEGPRYPSMSPAPMHPSQPQPDAPIRRGPLRTQWLSIELDAEAAPRADRRAAEPSRPAVLHVASFEDRAMAAVVDIGLVASAFLLFVGVFAFSTTHFPSGRVALAGAAAILVTMGLLYQYLFFTVTDATPGMRYARIALCTFEDENPTRNTMRARIAALLLSAMPLGLGFLWAVFDEDSLGWHDRITRTYQRSYRDLED